MESGVTILAIILGLAVFAVLIGVMVWLAWWMLEPINRAAGALNAPTRFMLTDFFGLMVLIQIGLVICGQALSGRDAGREAIRMYWLLVAVVVFLAIVLWIASISAVSRAGILGSLRRLVVIVLLVPSTLSIMLGLPTLVVLLTVTIVRAIRGEMGGGLPVSQAPLLALGVLGIGIVVPVLRWLAFWSLSGTAPSVALEAAHGPVAGCLGPAPLAEGFVEEHGSGGREVQAIDPSKHRQAEGNGVISPP